MVAILKIKLASYIIWVTQCITMPNGFIDPQDVGVLQADMWTINFGGGHFEKTGEMYSCWNNVPQQIFISWYERDINVNRYLLCIFY